MFLFWRKRHRFSGLHVIITRFNLGRLEDSWLAPRCQLFERFTLPSLRAQTCQEFHWLLLADKNTPATWQSRLRSYESENTEFHWTNNSQEDIRARIDALRRPDHSHLITTRLDNDDALCRTFVQRLQQVGRADGDRHFLNFPSGYCWYQGKITQIRHRSNAFISCSEPFDGYCTVHSGLKHTEAGQLGTVRQIHSRLPAWLCVCHESNILNAPPERPPSMWRGEDVLLPEFALNLAVPLLAPTAVAPSP